MQTSFWDTNPNSLSSGNDTLAESSDSSSPGCGCTRETPGCSIHPRGLDEWTACMRDFLARILTLPEWVAVLRATDLASGQRLSGALMLYDPQSSSLKTVQQSFLEDLTESYQTLPAWGSMRNGAVYQQQQLVRPTDVIGGGALQDVPTASEGGSNKSASPNATVRPTLSTMARKNLWPTVCNRDYKDSMGSKTNRERRDSAAGDSLGVAVGGQLNPTWGEWLMGFPVGSTALKD